MKTFILVTLLYFFVATLITFPLIVNLNTLIPYFPNWLPTWLPAAKDWAPTFGDSHFFPWFLWWFKKALFDLHQNPLTTGYLFAPQEVFLGSSLENLINILLSLPLQLFFSPIVAYNLLIIFNFALAGTAVFYFVSYLLKDSPCTQGLSFSSAFIAGLFFLTSSFMVLRSLGHFNIQTTAYLIFFLLFFIRIFELKKIRDGVFAAMFLFLTALSSWYYFFYSLIIGLLIALYFWHQEIIQAKTTPFRLGSLNLRGVLAFLFLSAFFFLPFIFLLYISGRAGVLHGHSIAHSIVYSSDLLSYFLPHRLSFLYQPLGVWADRFLGLWIFGGNTMEKTAFLGLSGLAAIGFYLVNGKDDPRRRLWLLLLGVAFILSLGPLLTAAGQISPIPLPYGFLYYFFPFFVFLRDPNRFSVFVFLLSALFLGYFGKVILGKLGKLRRVLFSVTFGLLIVLDNLVWPYPLIKVGDNSFYQSLKADKTDFTILNLPLREDKAANHPYLFAQLFHEKKMINGAVQPVGYTEALFNPIRSYPLSLLNCDYQKTAKDVTNQSRWVGDLKKYLQSQNVRYIIWHKDLPVLDEICPEVVNNQSLVIDSGGLTKVYVDEDISVFVI